MLRDVELEIARNLLLDNFNSLGAEMVAVGQAFGRIAYQPIFAQQDLPSVQQAAVDGYTWPVSVKETEWLTISAPDVPGQTILLGTGDAVPTGCQAVIPTERCLYKDSQVRPQNRVRLGENIRQVGEDLRVGDLIIDVGQRVSAGHLTALAALGSKELMVYRTPRVAILTLSPGVIRDSNSVMLAALSKRDGARVEDVAVNHDGNEPELLAQAQNWLNRNDMLITIGSTFGGSSLDRMLQQLPVQGLFYGTKFHPGGHNAGSDYRGKPVVSLSGNPAACLVGYELLVNPLLKKMQGFNTIDLNVTATCEAGIYSSQIPSRKFLRGRLTWRNDGWKVTILPGQKPGMVKSLLDYNCLIEVRPEQQIIEPGNEVRVYPLGLESFGG